MSFLCQWVEKASAGNNYSIIHSSKWQKNIILTIRAISNSFDTAPIQGLFPVVACAQPSGSFIVCGSVLKSLLFSMYNSHTTYDICYLWLAFPFPPSGKMRVMLKSCEVAVNYEAACRSLLSCEAFSRSCNRAAIRPWRRPQGKAEWVDSFLTPTLAACERFSLHPECSREKSSHLSRTGFDNRHRFAWFNLITDYIVDTLTKMQCFSLLDSASQRSQNSDEDAQWSIVLPDTELCYPVWWFCRTASSATYLCLHALGCAFDGIVASFHVWIWASSAPHYAVVACFGANAISECPALALKHLRHLQ